MSRKSEREAAQKIQELLSRHSGAEDGASEYGMGRLTKAQKKSQDRHIPFTPGPDSAVKRIGRKIWG